MHSARTQSKADINALLLTMTEPTESVNVETSNFNIPVSDSYHCPWSMSVFEL